MLYRISNSNLDFKSLCLDQPVKFAVDPVAEVENSSMVVSAEEIREMVYHTSSIGCIVDLAVKNHKYTYGTALGPEMMIVISSALKKCSSCFVEKSHNCMKLNLVAEIVSNARLYYNCFKDYDLMDVHSAKKEAVAFLKRRLRQLSKSKDPERVDILFPGGWPEHAIMYGIHKDLATNTYTFCLWNTGEGLEYHHSRGNKYQLKATWSSLKFFQVSNQSFLERLFVMKYQNKNTCRLTYKFIERHFRKAQDPPSDCPKDYRPEQSNSECVWKSIWVAVADLLGRKEDPLLVSQAKTAAITTMRQNLLEKIILKEADSIDPVLIMAIKKIERRNIKKIIIKAAIKALDQNENTYAAKLKLLEQDKGKCFHTLSKIPEFTVDSYSLLRRRVRLGFFKNPKMIREISCFLKNPMKQFQNLSEFKFRQLVNICKTKEGLHRYHELCKADSDPQLHSIINKIAKTQKNP